MEKAPQSVVPEAKVSEMRGNHPFTNLKHTFQDVVGNLAVFIDELPFRQPSRLERFLAGTTALALLTEPLAARTAIVMAQEDQEDQHTGEVESAGESNGEQTSGFVNLCGQADSLPSWTGGAKNTSITFRNISPQILTVLLKSNEGILQHAITLGAGNSKEWRANTEGLYVVKDGDDTCLFATYAQDQPAELEVGIQDQQGVEASPNPTPEAATPLLFPEKLTFGGGKIIIHNMGKRVGIDIGDWGFTDKNGNFCPAGGNINCDGQTNHQGLTEKNRIYIENILAKYNPKGNLEIFLYDNLKDYPFINQSKVSNGNWYQYDRQTGNTIQAYYALSEGAIIDKTVYDNFTRLLFTIQHFILGHYYDFEGLRKPGDVDYIWAPSKLTLKSVG
ncbi:MAG: hypothetical protein AAB414_05555 [Patescibacteria group bacterium]